MNIQEEIRVLNTAIHLIENYVNYSICSFQDNRDEIVTSVLPTDQPAKKYFFILLLELFSGVHTEMISSKIHCESLLDLLLKISIAPKLDEKSTTTKTLKDSVELFKSWIGYEFQYEIYSANINQTVNISLTRKDAIYLIGNRYKHNLLRSNSVLKKLVSIYKNSGLNIETQTEILLLDAINNWLFDDFAGYHFTKLCELSANIYYGIVEYVQPIYVKQYEKIDEVRYLYKLPPNLIEQDSKFEYYDLLNKVRLPFIPKIKTWEYLEKKL